MNVKQLKKIIASRPDAMEIILQRDSEGNGYSPCAGADTDAVYIADSTKAGTVYNTEWTAPEADLSEEEWKEIKSKARALILFPVQ